MLWALVMAGGQGTRFWPESRVKNPKQFLRVLGNQSLLGQTIVRIKSVIPSSRILIVTQESKIADAARQARIPKKNIIGEPIGRNTAPCAALIAALVLQKDTDAVLAILPSDHHIENKNVFVKALKAAAKAAGERRLPVTFGIEPDFPHTGYGYLERTHADGRSGGFTLYRLKQFHEKPDFKKAKAFLKTKRFYWNSGMFVWRADEILKAAKKFLPEVYRLTIKITAAKATASSRGLDAAGFLQSPEPEAEGIPERGDMPRAGGGEAKRSRPLTQPKGTGHISDLSPFFKSKMKRLYHKMPDISIDYGLMEKLRGKILTLPVNMGWSDVGDWNTLAKYWPKDASENSLYAKTLMIDSCGNIVKGGSRLIVFVGMKDCVVVDTPDALLVCSKHKTEQIRKVAQHIKAKNWHRYL